MSVVNLPNIITALRIAVIPFLSLLLLSEFYYAAFLVFIIASFTDLLDGYLARRLNKITAFGICFDPFADKLFFLSILIVLTVKKQVPLWFSVFIFSRDLVVAIGSVFSIYNRGPISIKPHITGKTVNLFLFIIILMKIFSFNLSNPSVIDPFFLVLYVLCVLFSGTSFFIYFFRHLRYSNLSD